MEQSHLKIKSDPNAFVEFCNSTAAINPEAQGNSFVRHRDLLKDEIKENPKFALPLLENFKNHKNPAELHR